MALNNKDKKIINDGSTGVSQTTPVEDSKTSSPDYYDMLKNESYRAMLDSNIQASNARDQSTKYLNNMLAQKGFGGQGVAESTNLGVYNQYQKALTENRATYNDQLNDIAKQKISDQNDNFQSATTLMQEASNYDIDTLNKVMKNYGVNVDSKGNLSGGLYDNMDDNSKAQMQTLYDMYSKQLGDAQKNNLLEATKNLDYDKNGYMYNLGEYFEEEVNELVNYVWRGSIPDNSVIRIYNSGKEAYLKWDGSRFVLSNNDEYKKLSKDLSTDALTYNVEKDSNGVKIRRVGK